MTREDADPRSEEPSEELSQVVDTVRELSFAFEPEAMAERYAERMQRFLPVRRLLTVTRRGFEPPRFGLSLARSWQEADLALGPDGAQELEGGILGEVLYRGEPAIIDGLHAPADDPAAEYLAGRRSLIAIPIFEHGVAVEMVIHTRGETGAFDPARLPELVWSTNLLARAAFYARRGEELEAAHAKLDRDIAYIAKLQQALLPTSVPEIPGIHVTICSRPSERSGGDYYDFFALPDGRFGVLLADVSGHGTATAVLTAITHSIVHLYQRPGIRPSSLLGFLNRNLAARYTVGTSSFVTAAYCIYDPRTRALSFARAGHPAPRIRRDGEVIVLDQALRPPLGVWETVGYKDATVTVRPGDELVLFTDGVTEARDAAGEAFGEERLDAALAATGGTPGAIEAAVERFAGPSRLEDDFTILALRFS